MGCRDCSVFRLSRASNGVSEIIGLLPSSMESARFGHSLAILLVFGGLDCMQYLVSMRHPVVRASIHLNALSTQNFKCLP